jgi:predicted metal-binding membrane protein
VIWDNRSKQHCLDPLAFTDGREHARFFAPTVACLAGLAWIVLFWLDRSGIGHHHHGHGGTLLAALGIQAEVGLVRSGVLFFAGWMLMMFAMMLPTALPLLNLFRRMTRGRAHQGNMLFFVLSGYLSIWLVFGLAILGFAIATSQWAPASFISGKERLLAAGIFLLAGIFQFLPLKHRCLDRCRAPLDSDMERWRDGRLLRNSFWLGLRQGVCCIGCCWALMLLMYAAGSAHLIWMLVLTVVIAVEKNMPWGPRLARPLGVLLLLGAAALLLQTTLIAG